MRPASGGESIELRFRTGAALLSRLGSEQLRDEITAVLELVKNAYDADATEIRVEIREGTDGQTLTIRDNGSGMSVDDLLGKWALIATENKVRDDRTLVHRRRRLGQKGVGRFAAEKLGAVLLLRTTTNGAAETLQVRFNWGDLSGDRELNEYPFEIKRKKADPDDFAHGTTLSIRSLRLTWTKARVRKLQIQLSQLIDPDEATTDFRIYLDSPWPELNGLLASPLPGNQTHTLEFQIDKDGRETIQVSRGGSATRMPGSTEWRPFGPIRGRLRYFGNGLTAREVGKGGEPDADW